MKLRLKMYGTLLLAFVLFFAGIPSHVSAEAENVIYTEAIQPKYEDAKGFSEGLAAVKRGGKWGYIDESGNVVIDFLYDDAHHFSEGKAIVEHHFSDDGRLIIKFSMITKDHKVTKLDTWYLEGMGHVRFDSPAFYNGFVALSADSGSGAFLFEADGEPYDDAVYAPTEGLYSKFNYYLPYPVEKFESYFEDLGFFDARPFNEGLAPVRFKQSKGKFDNYFSLLKKDGTLWKGPKFYDYFVINGWTEHRLFNEYGLASIMNDKKKWGAVNKDGKMVIPFKYDRLSMFSEGLAMFSKGGKVGYINIDEEVIIPPTFDNGSLFSEGLAVVRKGNEAYIINQQGEKVKGTDNLATDYYFDTSYEIETVIVPSDFIVIEKNGKYGFAKKQKVDPFADYRTWTPLLKNKNVHHEWEIQLNMEIDKKTVNDSNVYIVDKDFNKVDFVRPVVKDGKNDGKITLKNNGTFKKGENYWIIIEPTVRSVNGKPLNNNLKAQFQIN